MSKKIDISPLDIQALKILVREYYDRQDERLAMEGKLGIKKGVITKETINGEKKTKIVTEAKKNTPERNESMLVSMYNHYESIVLLEKNLSIDIAKEIHKYPLWKNFLQDVKGIGEGMAAVIITEFDINKAPCVSNLWSFAGLAPGKDRKIKGQKCPYNQFLRSKLCGVLGSSFIKCQAPYSQFYYNMKTRLEAENWGMDSKNPVNKDKPKAGHQHKAAIRYMIKMFLKDLYVAWRTLEGLSVREPYQEEYLGKKHHIA
jgi:hypothetical protein